MTDDGMLVSRDSVPLFVSDRQDRGFGRSFTFGVYYESSRYDTRVDDSADDDDNDKEERRAFADYLMVHCSQLWMNDGWFWTPFF